MAEPGPDGLPLLDGVAAHSSHGRRGFNDEGFAFYHRILDELEKHGIEPLVTLYHWDLPQPLEDLGGWPDRATVDRFVEYARRTVEEFKDRVTYWTTFNEPWCTAFLGYSSGAHAPGRSEPAASLAAAHHLNLAHGLAYAAIKEVQPDAKVSIVLNSHLPRPWNAADPRDVGPSRRRSTPSPTASSSTRSRWASTPRILLAFTSGITDWSFVHDGDLDAIKGTLDVVGVNYYSSHIVRHQRSGPPSNSGEDGHKSTLHRCWPGADDVEFMPLIGKRTTMNWNVDPSGFHAHLMRMHRDMGLPIIVTENGASWPDEVSDDGRIRDIDRYTYLHDHMRGAPEGPRRGCGHPRIHGVEPHGQLRVGLRILQAIRPFEG